MKLFAIATATSLAALSGAAFGQAEQNRDTALPTYEEGASVILSGTIQRMGEDEFVLDYGQDQVTVDLDDWLRDPELTEQLREGQQVTVSGTVDDDWFENREIEADNIYVTRTFSYYYIVDENPAYAVGQQEQQAEEDGTFLSTRGEVVDISGEMLKVKSQGNTLEVDISELAYNPLDEQGVQRIEKGDRVYVFGDLDENFFETKTITAESVISLNEASQNGQRQRSNQQPSNQGQSQQGQTQQGQSQQQQSEQQQSR